VHGRSQRRQAEVAKEQLAADKDQAQAQLAAAQDQASALQQQAQDKADAREPGAAHKDVFPPRLLPDLTNKARALRKLSVPCGVRAGGGWRGLRRGASAAKRGARL